MLKIEEKRRTRRAELEKNLHKKEHHKHALEVKAAGNVMDDLSKKQVFKKFTYRGNDIGKLLDSKYRFEYGCNVWIIKIKIKKKIKEKDGS